MNALVAHKRILTFLNVLAVSSLIFFYYTGAFDVISWPVFVIGVLSVIALALYNPFFSFALFIGVIPLEIIDLSPESVDFTLRPYQLMAVVTFVGFAVRKIMAETRLIASLPSFSVADMLIATFVGISIVSMFFVPSSTSVGQTIIVLSFVFVYFVLRLFVQSKEDVITLFPIVISSGAVVAIYAIVQNMLYKMNLFHREVMPGRPNATFAEADWLGVYLVFIIAVTLAYLHYSTYHKHLWKFFNYALFATATTLFSALIITVARSAWLGAVSVVMIYLLILFFSKRYNKLVVKHFLWISATSVLGVIVVLVFGLTSFELDNRISSTSSGLQEITISCNNNGQVYRIVPKTIDSVSELEQYNCRHINLEEINTEKTIGNTVMKIYRKDPNVVVRSQTYEQVIKYIKQRPFTGFGWGGSGKLLGTDESGTPLNASNIFLETALSIGLIGASILIVIFLSIITEALKILRTSRTLQEKSIAIFAILGVVAIIVPNLFNAGLLLGFVWMFFGMVAVLRKV